jgi:hypothetical protein
MKRKKKILVFKNKEGKKVFENSINFTTENISSKNFYYDKEGRLDKVISVRSRNAILTYNYTYPVGEDYVIENFYNRDKLIKTNYLSKDLKRVFKTIINITGDVHEYKISETGRLISKTKNGELEIIGVELSNDKNELRFKNSEGEFEAVIIHHFNDNNKIVRIENIGYPSSENSTIIKFNENNEKILEDGPNFVTEYEYHYI